MRKKRSEVEGSKDKEIYEMAFSSTRNCTEQCRRWSPNESAFGKVSWRNAARSTSPSLPAAINAGKEGLAGRAARYTRVI